MEILAVLVCVLLIVSALIPQSLRQFLVLPDLSLFAIYTGTPGSPLSLPPGASVFVCCLFNAYVCLAFMYVCTVGVPGAH